VLLIETQKDSSTGFKGSAVTGQKIWSAIKDSAYKAFIPPQRHIQSKAETFTV
jgi:hypothetical protein